MAHSSKAPPSRTGKTSTSPAKPSPSSSTASSAFERTGSNTAGDLLRLLPWLANEGAARTGGLQAGQWITTGSWTGSLVVEARATVGATFASLGTVTVTFMPEQNLEKGLPGVTRRFS